MQICKSLLESFRPQQGAPSAGTRARERGGAGRVRPTQGATRGGGSAHERRSARGSSGPHRPHSSFVQSAFQRRATRTSEPMASSRRLCCYTLLAICLAIASCSAAAVDSGRDVSRQLVLRFPAVPARPVRVSVVALPPGPCRRVAACCCELRTAQLKNSRPRARSFRCCVEAASSTGPTPPASSRGSGARLPRSGSRVGP